MKSFREHLISIWMKIPKPYPALARLAAVYDSRWRRGTDILFLGDSVVERISWHDTDKRTLDRMVVDLFADRKSLLCIAHAAYHFRLYYHLLEVLRYTRNKPELVILPINMRCFSPQWDLNPAWQFEEEIRVLQAYPKTRRIPAIRGNADELTYSKAELALEVSLPFTELRYFGQFLDIIKNIPPDLEGKFYRRKQIYILHYLKTLTRNHRRLQSFVKILDLLNELQIRALIYVTPINHQGGVRHVGEGFVNIIRSNVALIRDVVHPYVQDGHVRFMDLQEYLTSEYFFHVNELTEHLNQSGRLKLANALVHDIEAD